MRSRHARDDAERTRRELPAGLLAQRGKSAGGGELITPVLADATRLPGRRQVNDSLQLSQRPPPYKWIRANPSESYVVRIAIMRCKSREGDMKTTTRALLSISALLALCLRSRRRTRSWRGTYVRAEIGDNGGDCNRLTPCKTFQVAHDKTFPNGEITVLDPGGYGAVTINRPSASSTTASARPASCIRGPHRHHHLGRPHRGRRCAA